MPGNQHPSREHLIAYAHGELSETIEEAVADHVEQCIRCEETVTRFEREAGTILEQLRKPIVHDPRLDEPECQRAVERARKMGPQAVELGTTSGLAPTPALVEFGQLREYRILAKVGQGGMGAVYKALHTKLDKVVAVKILPAGAMQDPQMVARFEREMRAVGKLEHPHIVRAMDAGCHEGTHFLVMEYVDGVDLAKIMRCCGRLRIADACEVIRQAALGLRHVDEHAFVHRDIKPSNLMLSPNGEVKILDLGLALLQKERMVDEEPTGRGWAMGTLDYMAPEQIRDSHTVDIRADIYSLGCTFYRLLTGEAPFSGSKHENTFEKMMAHLSEPLPPIRQARPDVPEKVVAVLERMMAKDRDARYAKPGQVVEELKPFCPGCDLAGLLARARKTGQPAQAAPRADVPILPAPDAPRLEPTRPARRAAPRVRDFLRRVRPYAWIVGACAAAVVLLGVIYITTAKGTVKIELSDPAAKVEVKVDGSQIDIVGLKEPLRLSVGEHTLEVSSGEFKTVTQQFTVHRGIQSLKVALVPKPKPGETDGFPLVRGEGRRQGKAVAGRDDANAPPISGGPAPPLAIALFDASEARQHQEAWAKHLGVPVEITNSIGMKLVLIPPGEFDMGSTPEEVDRLLGQAGQRSLPQWYLPSEAPRHRVKLTQAFYLGHSEVTQAQYQKVMGSNPSRFKESGPSAPVEMVPWDDAVRFCQRLSALPAEKNVGAVYRLPTEAEWEYAARAGTTTAWCFGDEEAGLADYAWWGGNSDLKPHPVGERRANGFGLFDVYGNVWEWCADWHGPYSQSPGADPAGPSAGASRVLRGGGWGNVTRGEFRCAHRDHLVPKYRSDDLGFRIARSLTPSTSSPLPPAAAASRSPAEIAARRQGYLDRYLKPLRAGKVEEVPESRYAALFPPNVKTDLVLAKVGLTPKSFADWECKRPLDTDRLKDGKTPYFKGYFDAQDRLRQVESFGPDGGLSDGPLGCAAVRYQYDSKNRLIQETFFGADGKPGENRYLVVAAHHAYDEQDRRVETRFYDKDGKPAEDHLGVHRRLYREGTDSLEYRSDGTRRVRWLPPINLGRRINAASSWHPAISFDAREMYFSSGWTGITYTALQEVVRTTWSVDHWSSPERVRVAGRPARGLRAALSSDGKLMAVVGWKRSPPGMHDSVVDPVFPQLPNYGLADIYIFERNGGEWQRVRNAGPKINRANEEGGAAFAPGTYTLYFSANLPDKPSELWVSDYEKGDWGEPRAVGIGDVWEPAFSPEGRRLFFVSKRKGSFGGDDIWMAEKQAAGWARPINLGTEVNGGGDDSRPSLTLNGNVLYYCSCCPWNLVATGHADSEIAIRHMANLYAWSDSQ